MKTVPFVVLIFALSAFADDYFFAVLNDSEMDSIFSVSYKVNGEAKNESSGNFSPGENQAIGVSNAASDVILNVQAYRVPGYLTTIFTRSYKQPVKRCFEIRGTVLKPQHNRIEC